MTDQSTLIDEIRSLLDRPPQGEGRERERVERTLTDGYARALQLEGERLRIERRLRSAVRGESVEEPGEVRLELSRTDGELTRLRGLLSTLRAHALPLVP